MNNNGMKIDTNSAIAIINKLKMYVENEEKIISNIKKILKEFDNIYFGSNAKIIVNKKNELYLALETMLENRKKYIIYLTNMINSYIELDNKTANYYNNNGIN